MLPGVWVACTVVSVLQILVYWRVGGGVGDGQSDVRDGCWVVFSRCAI